jgi:hypothetical protein
MTMKQTSAFEYFCFLPKSEISCVVNQTSALGWEKGGLLMEETLSASHTKQERAFATKRRPCLLAGFAHEAWPSYTNWCPTSEDKITSLVDASGMG